MRNRDLFKSVYKAIVLEICELGNLEEYKDVIARLCDVIEHNNCNISCHEKNIPSIMQFEGYPLIHLAVKGREKPIHIIWDLMYEYGHFLSGPPKKGDFQLERELQAWKHARKLILKHPRLMPHLQDFKKYKEVCLNTYKTAAIGV